jgi:hypothetical protein
MFQNGSLNSDERNIKAEQLAMEECMKGLMVQRVWSEEQMVCTFGGGMAPGTPDGMFEDINGSLTCVQVVRVPVLPGSSLQSFKERVYDTVLTKLIKSQTWMKFTRIVPQNFIVFCWFMPFLRPRHLVLALRSARRVLKLFSNAGWPFSLKAAVPDSAEEIFPERFASQYTRHINQICIADILHFSVDVDSDDGDPEFDIWNFEFDTEEEVEEEQDDEQIVNEHEDTLNPDTEESNAVEEEEEDEEDQNLLEAPLFDLLSQYAASIFLSTAIHHLKKPVEARPRPRESDGKIEAVGATPIYDLGGFPSFPGWRPDGDGRIQAWGAVPISCC